MCYLSGWVYGGPWDLLGNFWEQEIQPKSPDSWCAIRDDGPSTDPDMSVLLRSETVWQWMTGLALYFLQMTGWTLYVPVTGAPASTLSPMPRQEKWSSVVEKAHSFWRLAITPTLSCGQERHLDAELPTDATELESPNRQCSSLCEYPEDEELSGPPHLLISWKCGVIMLGQMEEPDIGMLCPQKWTSGTSCDTEGWICGSMRPWNLSWQTSPRIWPVARFVSKLTFEWTWAAWRSRPELEDLRWNATPHPSLELLKKYRL